METRLLRLARVLLFSAIALVAAGAASAATFTVHSYELGERIRLTTGTQVYTAQLDVSVEGIASHVPSFCVDLDTHISVGGYTIQQVIDAGTGASPAGEAPRNLAWAGHVMENFGNVNALVGDGISRTEAITGVQAAIWEGIYAGATIDASSLSADARRVFERIMATSIQGDGSAIVIDLRGYQDQIIVGSNPVPEPSAALVFGLGSVIVGSFVRRRSA